MYFVTFKCLVKKIRWFDSNQILKIVLFPDQRGGARSAEEAAAGRAGFHRQQELSGEGQQGPRREGEDPHSHRVRGGHHEQKGPADRGGSGEV